MNKPPRLDYIVIGAQKAGSTYLMQCLQDHPSLHMPRSETPFFEDPDYDPSRLSDLNDLLRNATSGQLRGIKRPSYLGQPEVPERIASHYPDIKLIAILREPLSRAISAYFHLMKMGLIPIRPVEVGLACILEGKYGDDYPAAKSVLTYGLYHQHLTRYFEHFQRQQIEVLIYDDIQHQPEAAIRRTYAFLGVNTEYTAVRRSNRPMAAIYSLNRLRLYNLLLPLAFKTSSDHSRIHLRSSLMKKMVSATDQYLLKYAFSNEKPTLSKGLANRVREYYRDDVASLRSLIGHNLRAW